MKVVTVKSEADPFLMDIDYLIEFPFFTSYFSECELDDDKPFDFELGQLYKGYGKFGVYNLGTFDLIPEPIRDRLQHLRINTQVEKILDYDICRTCRDTQDLRVHA